MIELLKSAALMLWYSTVIVVLSTFISAIILSVFYAIRSGRLDR
jgi:hypothetical protein